MLGNKPSAVNPSQPYHIKVSNTFSRFPLLRQTPHGTGRWKDCQFHVHTAVEECDAWFIFDGLEKPEQTSCPPSNVFFIASEPPAFKTYDQRWLERFPHVLTYNPCLRHPGRLQSPLGIHWFVEKNYEELSSSEFPTKDKSLSVICSKKATTEGHRQRLRFVEKLSKLMPMDVFGRGFTPIKDKWDGLAPYRYSVAIENCAYPDYWSEKIADCFLAGTVPLYFGCPNISDYFPADALMLLDIRDERAACRLLQSSLSDSDYARRLPALAEAKRRVLEDYNLFSLISQQCACLLRMDQDRTIVHLEPEPAPSYWRRKLSKWGHRLPW